jgi:hypothetical protein
MTEQHERGEFGESVDSIVILLSIKGCKRMKKNSAGV